MDSTKETPAINQKDLKEENDKLKQEIISLKQEIKLFQEKLQYKDLLLKISNNLQDTAREVLEEMKAEQDRFGKRIVKQLEKLREPPIDTVGMYHAESLDSVMPKSTSEDSDHNESKISEVEGFGNAIKYSSKLSEHKQSDSESNHGSSRSDKTVVSKLDHLRITEDTRSFSPSKTKKKFEGARLQSDEDELSDTTGIQSRSDANRSIPFEQPTGIESPSGTESELSGDLKPSRHTKEVVTSPLSSLPPQFELNENLEVEQFKLPSSHKHENKKSESSQPADNRKHIPKPSRFNDLLKTWKQREQT